MSVQTSRLQASCAPQLELCRFICDFIDEVPDDIFHKMPHLIQTALQSPTKPRSRVQYYVMGMHSMSLANALEMFKV